MKVTKLLKKKMMYINAIKGGNYPTEIYQKHLTKAGLVVQSRWCEEALMKENARALLALYNQLNDLNTI